MKDKAFTKREKIITITAALLIVGLLCIVIFEYFTIVNTQKELSKLTADNKTVSNDGKIVWMNPEEEVSPTDNEKNEDITEASSSDNGTMEYVINKNSKKIHSPECESAQKTLDKNKETVNWTDEEYMNALENGYSPCSICKAGR